MKKKSKKIDGDDNYVFSLASLMDVNGDGLVDYVRSEQVGRDDTSMIVYYNDGDGFVTGPYGDPTAGMPEIVGLDATSMSFNDVGTTVFEAPGAPASVSETDWVSLSLFGGDIQTFHPTETRTWRCSDGQTEAQCVASGALLRETTTWTAQLDRLYAATKVVSNDRVYDRTYALWTGDEDYRLREVASVATVDGGAMFGMTTTAYDTDGLVPLRVSVSRSDDPADVATTAHSYDLATGNLLTVRKPQQYADASLAKTAYVYDDTKTYVVRTTNELGHAVVSAYDPGTGALLATEGPNAGEATRTDVDGFGRPLATWVSVADSGGFTMMQTERVTYDDRAFIDSGAPTSVRVDKLIEFGIDEWTRVDTEVDGAGRPIREISHTFDPGGFDAITAYRYDAAGKLAAVDVPDPRVSDDSIVTYIYRWDSLGRPMTMRTPDGAGTDMIYDGLVHTRREHITDEADGGQAAVRVLTHDVHGRLVAVDELLDDGQYARTTYGYDPNDNLEYIEDPDGVVTEMAHDWVGNRLRIDRSERVWTYAYDLNGNLVSKIAPHRPDEDVLAYTTSIAYDALDRVTSKLAGTRRMGDRDLTDFGAEGLTTYDYDGGDFGVGRLSRATTPWGGRTDYGYDERGFAVTETRSFDLRPRQIGVGFAEERVIERSFNALGLETDVHHADGATHTWTEYDRRGLPEYAKWRRSWSVVETLARNDRNVAGLVTHRTRPNGTLSQQAQWAYDALGRVAAHSVWTGSGWNPQLRALQQLTYYDGGDPKALTNQLEGSAREMEFFYDTRHQLVGAYDDAGFVADYAYTDGGRTAFAQVHADASAPMVHRREVTYEYRPGDLELLDVLRSTDGSEYASYSYDSSGNVLTRDVGGDVSTFDYDGEERQRRAVAPDGSEELYYYDHDGMRMVTVARTAGRAVTKVRLWFGETELHFDANGAETRSWVHVSLGTPVARIEDGDSVEFTYHSTLGSLLVSIGENNKVAGGFAYGPFGEVLEQVGRPKTHLRRFNGKEWDEASGLSYYGYRYYDPLAMRWTQADPLYRVAPDIAYDDPRRMNLYTFVLNNPMKYVDRDGQDAEEVPQLVVAGAIAIGVAALATANAALKNIPTPDVGEFLQDVRDTSDKVLNSIFLTSSLPDKMKAIAMSEENPGDGSTDSHDNAAGGESQSAPKPKVGTLPSPNSVVGGPKPKVGTLPSPNSVVPGEPLENVKIE